ncbi:MAG: prepilin-type N-terminal cleavage/methylation domain-containing protein [Gemmatimonadota bacterium]|nr:prepilin-type N-terminal cleavage/methylation domain-containing protein [Gemmatimonadota bacterium]MDH5196966.1 prepilin-type N-terminal cleavage/methylation domain-containing protein [Gemmatimonadota bacterium]
MTRRGFTLIELLVTLVVFAILATALARLMITNSRFVSQQEALLEARQTARAAMNVMLPELRMVTDGGLVAAAPDSVTVRVPYVFGVFCQTTFAVLAPTDSVVYATAVPAGIAYQNSGGLFVFDPTVTITGTTASTAACDADSIRAIPGGQRVEISATSLAPPGRLFYMYQTVTYKFASSAALTGRRALWRHAVGTAPEELLAPFDTAARFWFLVGSRLTPQAAPPGTLAQIRGLEPHLVGASVSPAQGEPQPARFALHPRVRFGNVIAP